MMTFDLYHNRIVADTMTPEFEESLRKNLAPLLMAKFSDILGLQMYEDYIADGLSDGEYFYYPMTVVRETGVETQWIRWSCARVNFEDGLPYSYIGSNLLTFELCDSVADGMKSKIAGRAIYCEPDTVKVRVDTLQGSPAVLSGKYSQTFIDEMARQLTSEIESACGIQGLAESTVELVMVFAPGTYMEHISDNVTYRRLMLQDKVSAPRDFWVQWTRLDGAVAYPVSAHVTAENIKFELGEDVGQKIREKEYRYLLSSGTEKYHNAMGRKKVTEWRDVIKRSAKRGELVKIETDYELAPETLELEERIADLLGKRPVKEEKAKEEVPFLHSDSEEYERAMERARMFVDRATSVDDVVVFDEPAVDPAEAVDVAVDVVETATETVEICEDAVEITEAVEAVETPDAPEAELLTVELSETDFADTDDESTCASPLFDVVGEIEDESDEPDSTESEELAVEIPNADSHEDGAAETVEFDLTEESDVADEPETTADPEAESDSETTAETEPEPEAEPKPEETAEPEAEIDTETNTVENTDSQPQSNPETTEAEQIDEPAPTEEVSESVTQTEEITEPVAEDDAPEASETSAPEAEPEKPKVVQTPIADRAADIRAEIETKIRLEYESRARAKAEEELIALRREKERLKMEKEAILAEARKEQERLRYEYERLLEETERAEAEREAAELQRRAEEQQLRTQIEQQLRAEAQERERLAEAARMAIEEKRRLEAENARIARQREEEERLEAQRRAEEEHQRQLEELRQAEIERIRREDEEAKARARAAMPEMGDGKYSYTSKVVKLLFRRSVDPNITTRIYEIIKATVEYYGKDRVYLKIRAIVPDTQTVILEFEHVPMEEMALLGNIIKILGNSGLGIAKAIVE